MHTKPQPQVQVIKGVTKSQLVKMAMQSYVGEHGELQMRQLQRLTKVELALRVQQNAYFAARSL